MGKIPIYRPFSSENTDRLLELFVKNSKICAFFAQFLLKLMKNTSLQTFFEQKYRTIIGQNQTKKLEKYRPKLDLKTTRSVVFILSVRCGQFSLQVSPSNPFLFLMLINSQHSLLYQMSLIKRCRLQTKFISHIWDLA